MTNKKNKKNQQRTNNHPVLNRTWQEKETKEMTMMIKENYEIIMMMKAKNKIPTPIILSSSCNSTLKN